MREVSRVAGKEATDHRTARALMDATERLLISRGHAGISTRRITGEAGPPHGQARYHSGSLDALMPRTPERASARIIEQQLHVRHRLLRHNAGNAGAGVLTLGTWPGRGAGGAFPLWTGHAAGWIRLPTDR